MHMMRPAPLDYIECAPFRIVMLYADAVFPNWVAKFAKSSSYFFADFEAFVFESLDIVFFPVFFAVLGFCVPWVICSLNNRIINTYPIHFSSKL